MFFKLYHADNFNTKNSKNFPNGYTHVANVECPNIDDVFHLTNHIDMSWWYNKWVDCIVESRSTSIGDIVINTATNEAFICAQYGWEKLKKVSKTV